MRLVITGDSHVVALGEALPLLSEEERAIFPGEIRVGKLLSFPTALESFFDFSEGTIKFQNRSIRKHFKAAVGTNLIDESVKDTIFALSLPFTTTVLLRDTMWRKSAPWSHGKPNRLLLSSNVLREIVQGHFRHIIEFFAAMKKVGLKVMTIGAPPPTLAVADWAREEDAGLVLHLDSVAREFVKAELAKLDVAVVDAPEEAFDQPGRTGFLRPEYAKDLHHATPTYGKLMLRQVLRSAAELAKH